jgi:hypothetical protein
VKRTIHKAVIFAAFGVASTASFAEDVTINGFLTTSAARLDRANAVYLNSFTDEARFDNTDSRLGLQFSGNINKRMTATAQLIARGRGGNNTIETDWAFVGIDVAPQTQVRTGKLKFPTFLISDYYEVGYAYPWIRPPQEVYTLNPLTTLVGVDMLYTPKLGSGNLLIQPYWGSNRGEAATTGEQGKVFASPAFTSTLPTGVTAPKAGDPISFSVPVLAGLNAVWNFPAGSFRMGYTHAEVNQELFGIVGKSAGFASVGLTIDWHNIVLYSEYADRNSDKELELAFPDQRAGYATLGYRMGKFLPHFTYAKRDEGADKSPTALKQTSMTAGLRYDVTENAALKAEYQYINPADGNTGLFNSDVKDARLYGVALDVIF